MIDGNRLLDLLFEHHVGVLEHSATLIEVDDAFFEAPLDEETNEESG